MREIKFRAWDKENNRMVPNKDVSIDLDDGTVECFTGVEHKLPNGDTNHEYVCIAIGNLMQFTGLKDKNGEEIYEGDIIKLYPLRKGEPVCIVQIIFERASFEMCSIDDKPRSYVRELGLEVLNKTVEVIGNIHKNPELLNNSQ